jgi:hypothetical protein
VTGERVLPEVEHQEPADAVDEVGKIFAEVEARAIGHESQIPAELGLLLLWAGSRDVKEPAAVARSRGSGHNALVDPWGFQLHLQQLQMHL